jgi:hypothetical protein
MSTHLISMSEIMRVAPWSLRALGHPFGVAERATRLLTWTQAAVGHALELLRIGEDQLAASTRAPAAERDGDGVSGRRVNGHGRNLLELGPPAIDLATGDARISGIGDVVIENTIGTLMVPAMADLAVRRDLTAVIAYRAGPEEVRLGGWPADGWIAACRGPGGPRFVTGDSGSLRALVSVFSGEMETRLLKHAAILAAAGTSSSALVTIAATQDQVPALDDLSGRIDYAERVARAYRSGLEVTAEDLAHLYALERITWAPTSERSRKQAGY